MLPDALTVEQLLRELERVQWLSTFGWAAAIGLAVFIWRIGKLVDRGCPECSHCVDRVRRQAEEDRQRAESYWGTKSRVDDSQATRERLFGRRVVDEPVEEEVAHDEGPLGGQDGGAGQDSERPG